MKYRPDKLMQNNRGIVLHYKKVEQQNGKENLSFTKSNAMCKAFWVLERSVHKSVSEQNFKEETTNKIATGIFHYSLLWSNSGETERNIYMPDWNNWCTERSWGVYTFGTTKSMIAGLVLGFCLYSIKYCSNVFRDRDLTSSFLVLWPLMDIEWPLSFQRTDT